MSSLLVELLPFALGLAITPAAITAGILLLSTPRAVANDLAFTAPFLVLYAAAAGVALVASGASSGPLISGHDKAVASLVVGAILLLLAVLRVVRYRRKGTPRKAGFLARIESATPKVSSAIGAVLAILNPNVAILFGGLAVITASDVAMGGQAVSAGVLVAASVLGIVIPLLWYLVRRRSATRGLARLKGWLVDHQRQVNVAVLVIFGLLFTAKGLAGL